MLSTKDDPGDGITKSLMDCIEADAACEAITPTKKIKIATVNLAMFLTF